MPLTDTTRPKKLSDMVGQQHLIGPGGILAHMADTGRVQSCIFFGPPGVGKSCTALILADAAGLPSIRLNATNCSVKDIQKAVADNPNGVLVYLDEIQYFNKKQQQSLLPYVEDGSITLIAATTENPYHDVYKALLSRCLVLEFKPVSIADVTQRIYNVCASLDDPIRINDQALTPEAVHAIAQYAAGDVRKAINILEVVDEMCDIRTSDTVTQTVTPKDLDDLMPSVNTSSFDRDGDQHYGYISALQKSIRGSDPDAAVFWLMKLLEGGDIISPARRLLVIACEDIGLACPDAISHTLACTQAAETLGLPEAAKPLTQATLFLALAPKSCTNEATYMPAQQDIHTGLGTTIPSHLRTACAKGYQWPHEYPNHWCEQQYLPDDLVGRRYYSPGDNPIEQEMYGHWQQVKEFNRTHPQG